ncbi:MBOAT family O-acyltransferase [Sinorhizobium chiapasense]|uniref:Probable alginate O-acetylase AlgI n=1 Tax=Sinorhizobium chiapasense TaxID=501572 RepID=A0ABZ2BHI5_9HYPH
MLFNSFEFFILYLPIVLIVFFALGRRYPNAASLFVGLASLFFISVWEISYAVILSLSILFNYAAAYVISVQDAPFRRKIALSAAITVNLVIIFLYKYLDFSVDTLNYLSGSHLEHWELVLPLGISFYTFTQTAFLVDTYRKEVRDLNFVRYLLFVTYFPHLVAGPILHHGSIIPQFAKDATYRVQWDNIATGFMYFTIGLAKKVILADTFALYATPVFTAADSGQDVAAVAAWTGALAYTFQIYFDFSGYSDMAVGLAKMMNVDIPYNFNSPYKATSIIDFWRRWHMSLSAFLRDYVYIPLGGSKRGSRYVNLMTTMLIGGLWHGASWTFVVWGGLHGLYLVVNHRFSAGGAAVCHGVVEKMSARLLTFLVVILAWVFFRSETFSGAATILSAMLVDVFHEPVADAPATLIRMFGDAEAPWRIAAILSVGLVITWFAPNSQEIVRAPVLERLVSFPVVGSALVFVMTLLVINTSRGVSEFIYFNF